MAACLLAIVSLACWDMAWRGEAGEGNEKVVGSRIADGAGSCRRAPIRRVGLSLFPRRLTTTSKHRTKLIVGKTKDKAG